MSEESEKSDGVGCELMYSGNGAAGYNANNEGSPSSRCSGIWWIPAKALSTAGEHAA